MANKSEYMKDYHKRNRQKITAQHKVYVSKNRNRVKEVKKARDLRVMYGITIDDYNRMFSEQGGCCAICGNHQSTMNKAMAVDHDHKSGRVRGLLCHSCNVGLGFIGDSLDLLDRFKSYLTKTQSWDIKNG